MIRLTTRLVLIAVLGAWALTGMASSALGALVWMPVYVTDFSTDPGWTTNDPAHLGRDAATNTFHGWQSNTNTSHASTALPGFDSAKSFRLEYDAKINSVGWSAGLTFGIWDASLRLTKGVHGDFSFTDGGLGQGFYAAPKETSDYSPHWSPGTWYRNVIEYDAATGIATLRTTDRTTGASVYSQALGGLALSSAYNRLGVSRIHMEGYTSNAVDYNLDNVGLYQAVPEPGSMALIVVAATALLGRRRRCGAM